MTVVDEAAPTTQPNVAGAVETTDTVASHLHPAGSWAVEDHPVPNGLEEVWRFTPLKRLRQLHADAALGTGSVTVDAGVHDDLSIRTVTGAESRSWRWVSGYVPIVFFNARATTETDTSLIVEVPAEV